MSRAAAVIIVVLAGLLLGAGGPAAAAQPTEPPRDVFEDGGSCTVCRFYAPDGYAVVNQNVPFGACDSALGPYAHSVACSGWSYWDRTRVWKARGDFIRVGFWYRGPDDLPTMAYKIYGAGWNDRAITVDRLEVGAAPYNVSTCAYDYTYGGDESLVLCEAIDW
jgi:hypothetical protein